MRATLSMAALLHLFALEARSAYKEAAAEYVTVCVHTFSSSASSSSSS